MLNKKTIISNLEFIRELNRKDQLDKDTLDQFLSDTLEHLVYGGPVNELPKYPTFNDYWKAILPLLWNIKEWDNERIKDWIQCTFEDARR